MGKSWAGPLSVAVAVVGVCIGASGGAWAQQAGDATTGTQQTTGVSEAPASQPVEEVAPTEPVKETPIAVSTQPVPAAKGWVDQVKQPVPWFNWGFDERWRQEYLNNAGLREKAPNRERTYQRYRSRLWGTVSPVKELDINMRLTWESRYWWKPDNLDGFQENNVVFDNLNFKLKQPFGLPVTMTVGRQDIILGDGWLVLDGTPLDGSRTIFFDAIRTTVAMKDINTTADVIYVQNYAKSNKYWPPEDAIDNVIEQDEKGAILWVANKSIKETEIDGYFIYKHNDAFAANGDDGDLYTPGARVVRTFGEHWLAKGEGALQFGNNKLKEVWAGGAKAELNYLFKDSWNNQLATGYEFLSGDRAGSKGTNEAFNPLWGRWPQWSELMTYVYASETRPAEINNLHRIWYGWQADPTKKLQTQVRYHLLFADRNTFEFSRPADFGGGCFRGQVVTAVARYKFNRFLSGHLQAEYFKPDGYYSPDRDDAALFCRAELVFAF